MANEQKFPDDEKVEIEVAVFLKEFAETNEKIAKLNMQQRIRILEFITGVRDASEIRDLEEASIVKRVLYEKRMGYISPELNPNKWHLPEFPDERFRRK